MCLDNNYTDVFKYVFSIHREKNNSDNVDQIALI